MPATVVSSEALQVLNLGASGALLQGNLPLTENAEYRMQLVLEGHVADAVVKIRRVGELPAPGGGACYQMGVEFLDLSPEAQDVIQQLLAVNQARV